MATFYELTITIPMEQDEHENNAKPKHNTVHTVSNGKLNANFMNGKHFELHQIPSDNNNVVVTETGEVTYPTNGLNGKGKSNGNRGSDAAANVVAMLDAGNEQKLSEFCFFKLSEFV